MELSKGVHRHITNNLRLFREMAGFTQREAAKRIGLATANTLSLWERGIYMPSCENLFRLSILYGRLPDDLYSGFRELIMADMKRIRLLCET